MSRYAPMYSFAIAFIYLAVFTFFIALGGPASDADSATKLAFMREHQVALEAMYLIGYVCFGLVLLALVLALPERLTAQRRSLLALGQALGVIWVAFVIAAGFIVLAGIRASLQMADTDAQTAWLLWRSVSVVFGALGGGNELLGGLWTLAVSLSFQLPKALRAGGIFVALAGVATLLPVDDLTAVFGLSQLLWFVALGATLWRAPRLAAPAGGFGQVKGVA